jgi:alpha-galactosidase
MKSPVRSSTRTLAPMRSRVMGVPFVLADGRTAVGLFNRGLHAAKIGVSWKDVGLTGSRVVRDLWAQKNVGTFANEFSATVPAHGTVLVAIGQRGAK